MTELDIVELNAIRLLHPERVVVCTHNVDLCSYRSTVLDLFKNSIDFSNYLIEHADLYEALSGFSVLDLPWLSDHYITEECDCCSGAGLCEEIDGAESSCMNCNGSGRLTYFTSARPLQCWEGGDQNTCSCPDCGTSLIDYYFD